MQDLTPPTPTDGRRLTFGLLLSLTIHAMLLTLTFGGQGLGLPGLGLPWQDRRAEAPDVRIVLLPTPPAAAEPMLSTDVEPPLQPVGAEPTMMKLVHLTPSPEVSDATSVAQARPVEVTKANTVTAPPPAPAPAIAPAMAALPAERQNETRAALPQPRADVITVAKSHEPTWKVPAAPEVPAPVTAVATPTLPDAADARQDVQRQAELLETERQENAKQAAEQNAARQEAARIDAARIEAERQELAKQVAAKQAAARQEAARQEAARADAARAEAARQEAAKQAAERQLAALQDAARAEAERKELSRQETARQEAARIEAERQELAKQIAAKQMAAKQAAAQQEAKRQEVARQEAARADAARTEVARAEAARQDAAKQAEKQAAARGEAERKEASRQESARQAAAQQEAARQQAALLEAARLAALQAEAEKRQEKLRAIGRQLNEEAKRREAAATQRQLPSASSVRRGRLFGRTDPNAELVLYAEAWSRKIQLNMTFDMVREAAKQPHTNPMVTVAVRSDGSVESVTFVTSSGVPAIDEAIRRIVHSQANYQAFPPALAREFDVIEIRRTWYFDMAIRLY